jgi:hypothetical protein
MTEPKNVAEVRADCLGYGCAIRQSREQPAAAITHAGILCDWILGENSCDLDPAQTLEKSEVVRSSCMALAHAARTGAAKPQHLTENADRFYAFVTSKKVTKAAAPKPDKPKPTFMRKSSPKKDDKK